MQKKQKMRAAVELGRLGGSTHPKSHMRRISKLATQARWGNRVKKDAK